MFSVLSFMSARVQAQHRIILFDYFHVKVSFDGVVSCCPVVS